MNRSLLILTVVLLYAASLHSAAPIVHGAMPPLHERPSQGEAIGGPGRTESTDGTMRVCIIRAQFLEDFTSETSGNGRFDLEADPAHDRTYFEKIADDLASYYEDVSNGQLTLEIDIYPTSIDGSYTMQHQMMYYGGSGIQGACLLLRDAVTAADDDINYSNYDAVMVIHAGSGQEADIMGNSPGDIGSVFLTLTDLIYYLPEAGLNYPGIPTSDGVYIKEGMIDPEQESQDGYGLGVLGTICHEFAHQLGLPDLYDTSTGHVGVGGWDLMGYGQWIMSGYWPSSLSAWSRIYLGWDSSVEVESGTFSLAFDDSILRVPLNSSEYLLIENRQRDPDGDGMCGIHERDFGLPGSGILIWHIDETRLGSYISYNAVNVDPDHKGVDLEEADGIQDFDYSLPDIYGYEGSEYDPWYQGGYAWEFSGSSEPSSDASWGGRTFVTVEVLDEPSNAMDVEVTRTTVCEGWPVEASPIKWGPLIWEDADPELGDRLVVTTTTGYVSAYSSDGSHRQPMGIGATAPPVAGSPSGGDPLLLVCESDGEVHLRDMDWNEPQGWPVTLQGGGSGIAALVSERLGIVAVADDNKKLYVFDSSGSLLDGWPRSVQAGVIGIAIYPDDQEPGLIASCMDGRIHLWTLDGVKPWAIAAGYEETGIPFAADIDRDGSPDVVTVSGDQLFAWDSQANSLPGFPCMLPAVPLSSPVPADPDEDGRLETVILTEEGLSAIGSAGSTMEDWPLQVQQDSLVWGFDPLRQGVGGSGFAMVSMDDGRICLYDSEGSQCGIFPVTVGDDPIGRPLLWDPEDSGDWRVVAADASGCIICWHTDFQPEGWSTGMDMSGTNCWWSDDLPPLRTSGDVLRDGSFYVYPNPVQDDSGVIRFLPGSDCTWEIRIFNMGGDLVTFKRGNAPGGAAWEVPWNTEDLAPGVYFVNLHISSDSGSRDAIFHAAVIN